jgi:radical SAM-linked protein
MRIRIVFKKTQAMRFTGHLDLQQTWMRVFRRAGIQLEYSQGFHQQPKLQLASALPLGYVSSGEVLDAWIKEELPLLDLSMKIQAALPPGLEVIRVEEIPLDAPKVQVALQSADYQITLPPNENIQELQKKISLFIHSTEILVERRGKTRNIRDLVEGLDLTTTTEDKGVIIMRLSARESATGRADEVLSHLGIDPYKSLIERISLNFA